ncbi:30 kDa heat shock protein [Cladobotryum mycophilum]|uniref:30 kDa heat shock protein n=1 Tax=Cladobotryum mycophilum TaxID=491253 RepID=A0ABR0SRU7_9HYPO
MAFFQRNFYTPESSFTPLFRLLEDFDDYSRQGNGSQHHGRRSGLPHWQPKFDVRETGESYELHGELPGMEKKDVHIEFTDPQTMLVRGKVERAYTAGTPPAGVIEGTTVSGAITGGEGAKETPSRKTTVEDEHEAASHDEGQVANVAEKKPVDTAKYWLTERSIGEFARSFSFPSRVNWDGVSANFKDGILNIVVPKAKHEARRRINVE